LTPRRTPDRASDCPTGKSLPICRIRVKPWNQKYFALSETQIRTISTPIPFRPEGRRPSSRTWDGDAVDADGACDDGARRVRQRRVVLSSSDFLPLEKTQETPA